ncbi:LuxR C-terminal-related transcriptional regulator [Pelosinus propionicus]|uniref:LuxR family transcriptional regulator, maltose regulon positive regulatory protein n=1 Tax=Pelosinus propionicus DSM 13327 TaxID=1123291 RepID=A0A1I4MCE2_9FIRM|nr:LuxR C-terminal-related transcriptional regulator [Pelosinus propionicus]SFM00723.1 LuxR family transcriptional regulator, maltose regulon positive regulatory protein [Pelosinus propionicus DSM 13327]
MRVKAANIIYIRQQLRQALEGIWEQPLTVVEAPMGYGKTTAVKDFLQGSDANVLWQTLADASASGFWRGFCRLLKKTDESRANRLAELGVPTDSVFMEAALELIGNIVFAGRTVLVFDDYHLLASPPVDQFIERLVKTAPTNLYIILVSRTRFGENTTELALKGFCQVIGKSCFEFAEKEIIAYYKLCGIRLRPGEAAALYAYTEGWISALYLSLLTFAREGKVERQASLPELLEKAVYRQCPPAVKEFLLTICVFDSFTLAQAKALCPQENAGEIVSYLMANNAFIKFDPYNRTYQLHNIFTGYLRELLEQQGAQRRRAVLQAAGSWYRENSDYIHAMDCFYESGDFDQLLLAFVLDTGRSTNIEHKETLIRYFTDCPAKIRRNHPAACLLYAQKLFAFDERDLYVAACREAGTYIETVPDEKTKRHLLGEFELIMSFAKYNDLWAMAEHHAKAYELLDGPARFYDDNLSSPSVLYLFYRQSGLLDQTARDYAAYMPRYRLITSGHGAGAEYVMQAELSFHRGDFEPAGIALHQALQAAQDNGQSAIRLCVLFLQSRLALIAGDLPAVWELLRQLRAEIDEYGHYQHAHTIDLCESVIYAQLGQAQKIPPWIAGGDLPASRLPLLNHTFFNIVYGKVLLLSGQELKLLGLTGHFLDVAGTFPNLLGQVYTHIYAAAAYHRLHHPREAQAALRQAVDIAAADQLIMPFVENGADLAPVLRELANDDRYAGFIRNITATYAAFAPKLAVMRAAGVPGDDLASLTAREREISGLVAAGLSNQTIAGNLVVAEVTVKKALQNIYAKLGIANRATLARLIMERNYREP